MRKIIYIISITGAFSCSTQRTIDIKHIIEKNKPVWIESWVNNPMLNLKTDGWQSCRSEYSYVYTKIPEYELFYVYSPSHNLFVDIYSRRMGIDINQNDTSIIYLEPESEIILSDTVRKTSDRLLYASDICCEDVIWITDVRFMVLSYSTFNDEIYPEILIFDIKKQQKIYYKGFTNKKRFDYLDKKMKTFR